MVGNSQLLTHTVKAQQLFKPIQDTTRLTAVIASNSPITFPKSKVSYTQPYTGNGGVYCSCVTFLRASGISLPRTLNGTARTMPVRTTTPFIGAVVVTNEGVNGHVAHVDNIVDNYLILNEANYVRCQQTKGRKLHIDSPVIIGYY